MSTNPFRLRITAIWLLLIAATGLSWESAHGFSWGDGGRITPVAVMIVAFIKVRFVGLDFMELRGAPLPLRLLFEAWAGLVCAAIIGIYWSGTIRAL